MATNVIRYGDEQIDGFCRCRSCAKSERLYVWAFADSSVLPRNAKTHTKATLNGRGIPAACLQTFTRIAYASLISC